PPVSSRSPCGGHCAARRPRPGLTERSRDERASRARVAAGSGYDHARAERGRLDSCPRRLAAAPAQEPDPIGVLTAIVTGAGGLVGAESAAYLCREGYDVLGLENDMRAR